MFGKTVRARPVLRQRPRQGVTHSGLALLGLSRGPKDVLRIQVGSPEREATKGAEAKSLARGKNRSTPCKASDYGLDNSNNSKIQ